MNSTLTHVRRHLGFADYIGRRSQRNIRQQGAGLSVSLSTIHPSLQMKDSGWLFEHNGFTAQLCCTAEAKELAYQLRYRAYRNAHAIPPTLDRMVHDKFDDQPNSRTHLIWYDGKPVASVRSTIWSKQYPDQPTESTTVFRKELTRCVGMETNFLESSHFVTAPEIIGRDSFYAQLLLFRLQDLSSRYDNCTTIITAVPERHISFYRRVLGFHPISMPRSLEWIDPELVLLRSRREESRELAMKRGMPACTEEDVMRYAECVGNN